MGAEQGLIRLEGVTKVFYTDEVETHALSGVHLEIKNGEFLSIAGPSGSGDALIVGTEFELAWAGADVGDGLRVGDVAHFDGVAVDEIADLFAGRRNG